MSEVIFSVEVMVFLMFIWLWCCGVLGSMSVVVMSMLMLIGMLMYMI